MDIIQENTYQNSEIEQVFPMQVYNYSKTSYDFSTPLTSGIGIGAIEIIIFLTVGFIFRDELVQFKNINIISYFWLLMTILTGIWEFAFISQYKDVHNYAEQFIQNKWIKNDQIEVLRGNGTILSRGALRKPSLIFERPFFYFLDNDNH